jgi:hypothetical protein
MKFICMYHDIMLTLVYRPVFCCVSATTGTLNFSVAFLLQNGLGRLVSYILLLLLWFVQVIL